MYVEVFDYQRNFFISIFSLIFPRASVQIYSFIGSAAPVAKRYAHTACCILHSLYCPTAGILPSKIALESSWNEVPGTGAKEYLGLVS